ncbi:hypothetical protein VMF7928_00759 [Vibrio marisflavi CECT 7928]|uniref:Uncharacterized protein n=1 Tax=Vibrio marisflavi CECT 7928 TaxID=634439 RepID=A0ABN8E1X5_9VIBR|nr:hypothetical protein VMF7928_00759 [Vibrio marisflavi CECT 7928]
MELALIVVFIVVATVMLKKEMKNSKEENKSQ